MLGSDFAASRKLTVGSTLPVGALEFAVVGILDKTLTAPDRFAMVPLEDARDVWLRRDPLLFRVFGTGGLTRADLNSGAAVGWQDGVDPDALARRIQAAVPGVERHHPRRAVPPAPHVHRFLLRAPHRDRHARPGDRGPLAREHGDRRRLRAHPRLRRQARPRRHRRPAPRRGARRGAPGQPLGRGARRPSRARHRRRWWTRATLRDGQQLFFFSPRLLGFTLLFALLLGSLAAVYATLRIARLSPAEAIRRGA